MSNNDSVTTEVETFLGEWMHANGGGMRSCFEQMYSLLRDLEDVTLTLVARPGISYSLRPRRRQQTDRELFAMIDVIDDDPGQRWLSVCFYQDLISDPEELGEIIPGGLAGSDGYCFDLLSADAKTTAYVKERLQEAWRNAAA